MALNGIDISSWQGSLNLDNINYDFVMIKATEGTNYVNPMCDVHYQEAEAAGKKRAVYHFTNFGNAIDEANFFVDSCAGYIRDAIFMLDWEGAGVGNVFWAQQFLGQVEARIGYKPIIYMSEWVENNYDWSPVATNGNGLVLAKYSDYEIDNNYDMGGAGMAPNTVHWPFYMMWQWTSKGRLNGYAGDLDCDIAYVDAAGWDKYAGFIPEIAVPPVVGTPPVAPIEVPVDVPTPTVIVPTVIDTPPMVIPVVTPTPPVVKVSKLASTLQLVVAVAGLSAVKGYLHTIFDPHTGLGRTIRGFLQSAIGLVGFLMLIVSLPAFRDFWVSMPLLTGWATPAAVIAIVTAIWNGLGAVIRYANDLSSGN